MTTYREMVYMVLDQIKASSDDFYYNEDHIIYLLDKYRAFLLKQKYAQIKKQVSQSNFQNIIITKKTKNKIPNILNIALPQYESKDNTKYNYCTPNRFEYVGISDCNKKSNYFTLKLCGDNLQLLTSTGNKNTNTFCSEFEVPDVQNCIDTIDDHTVKNKLIKDRELPLVENYLTAVFESPKVVYQLENEDVLDKTFPLEEALISPLLEMVNKDLSSSFLKPQDTKNDGKDDLGDLNRFMYQNSKSELQKQLYG